MKKPDLDPAGLVIWAFAILFAIACMCGAYLMIREVVS